MASSTDSSSTEAARDEFDTLAERVDRAVADVNELGEPARAKSLALKSAIEAFHKLGLTRIVKAMKDDPRGQELLFELVDDPAVHALFLMHGIVRADPRTRVERVLDMVRPYIQSHGGDVELVDIEGDTAFVRLSGSCHGCSMSAVTLRETVEEAIREHVPEVTRVQAVAADPGPAVIPVESLRPPGDLAGNGWVKGPRLVDVGEVRPVRVDLPGGAESVVLIRLGETLQAFRNACAHMGLTLDGGLVDPESCTLTCPWHGFRFDARTGECLTAPQAQLEVLPYRIQEGVIWIRPQ